MRPVDPTVMSAGETRRGRVLMLVENNPVPRDARVWSEVCSLVAAGYEVVVICPQGRDVDREPFVVHEGVAIHRFPLAEASEGKVGYLSEYLKAFWHTLRLARRLEREGPFAVVHAANPPDILLIAAWPLKRHGARFIFDQHDALPELYLTRFDKESGLGHRLTVALERLSFRLADVVIAPNASYARIATERGRKRPEDVFIVRNGPDLSLFTAVAPDPELKRGRRHLIAYAGAMSKQDGIDEAVRALAILRRTHDDWHAVFVGDGDAVAASRSLAVELGLADHVEFTGIRTQREVVGILSAADVCLAPEPSNPFNDVSTFIKVAEYMALERPVVAYDLAETRYTAGPRAAYARPGDTEGFAALIAELLDDPARRQEMGAAGRARVEAGLTWERSEQSLLEAYDRALSNRGDRRPARLRLVERVGRRYRKPRSLWGE